MSGAGGGAAPQGAAPAGVPRPEGSPARPGGRVAALDGLRGLVIVSVVLNHAGGVLWPRGAAYETPVVAGLLGGGAVVVFFVLGGFLVTLGLLRERAEGRLDPWRFALRRLVRLLPQLLLLCVVVGVALTFDPVPPATTTVVANASHVLTFTFNDFAAVDLFAVRGELGHLWYLSVQQQCYLLLPLVLLVLGGRRRWRLVLGVLLVAGAAGIYVHRQVVLDERGWVVASSLTTTRADGLLWGVALALALGGLGATRGRAAWSVVLVVSGAALLALHLLLPELPPLSFLGPWSLAFTAVAGVVVLAVWLARPSALVVRALAVLPLRALGRASYTIYLWHLPIVLVVTRHTPDWRWQARTVLALVVLVVVVVAVERYLEDPVRRLLATGGAFRLPRLPARAAEHAADAAEGAPPEQPVTAGSTAPLRALLGLAVVLLGLGHVGLLVDAEGLRVVRPFDAVLATPVPAAVLVVALVAHLSTARLLRAHAAGLDGAAAARQVVVAAAVPLAGAGVLALAAPLPGTGDGASDRLVVPLLVLAATVLVVAGAARLPDPVAPLAVAGVGAALGAGAAVPLLVGGLGAGGGAGAAALVAAGLGAAGAAAARVVRLPRRSGTALLGSVLLVVPAALLAPSFLGAEGAARALLLAVVCTAVAAFGVDAAAPLDPRTAVARVLAVPDLARGGRWWLVVLVATGPVAAALAVVLDGAVPGVVQALLVAAAVVAAAVGLERAAPGLLRPGLPSGAAAGHEDEGSRQEPAAQR